MSLVLDRGRIRTGQKTSEPSIREVCLVGNSPRGSTWAAGDRVKVSGKAYRVESVQGPNGEVGDGRHYAHLAAEPLD